MKVYIAIYDNGFEFGCAHHEETILGAYTSRDAAQLALFMRGFTEEDATGFLWHKAECAWVVETELHEEEQ